MSKRLQIYYNAVFGAIGGLIATGTHGSSLTHGNLASLVTRLCLITATGDALDVDGSDPHLDGMRVHLGALGVGLLDDLLLLAPLLGGVVLGVAAGGQVAAQAHRDGARRDLGQARRHPPG